jgi:hypothetical protein
LRCFYRGANEIKASWRVKTRNWSAEQAGSRPKQWTGSMQFLLQSNNVSRQTDLETEFRFHPQYAPKAAGCQ